MTPDKDVSDGFAEMTQAANKAASEINANPPSSASSPAPANALLEEYERQIDLNHKAHREMRWVAFITLGALLALFLFILLFTLVELLDRNLVLKLLEKGVELNWHVLVFFSVLVAVFAAVPLSLAMALVKMISLNQHTSDGGDYKTPTTELGKVILELIKSVAQAAKPG